MNFEKYLPLGSIVTLKENDVKLMIVGYQRKDRKTEKTHDYSACIYPIGIKVSSTYTIAFNHKDIDKVYYIGYKDEVFTNISNVMKKIDEKMGGNGNDK